MSKPNYILNPDGSFMSAEQIITDLLSKEFDEEAISAIVNDFKAPDGCDATTRIMYAFYHSDFGRLIRNCYGLWDMENPHVYVDAPPNADNIIDHPLFPDNFSGMIMDRFAEVLKTKQSKVTFEL